MTINNNWDCKLIKKNVYIHCVKARFIEWYGPFTRHNSTRLFSVVLIFQTLKSVWLPHTCLDECYTKWHQRFYWLYKQGRSEIYHIGVQYSYQVQEAFLLLLAVLKTKMFVDEYLRLKTVACTFHYRPWTGSIKTSLQHLQFCCCGFL